MVYIYRSIQCSKEVHGVLLVANHFLFFLTGPSFSVCKLLLYSPMYLVRTEPSTRNGPPPHQYGTLPAVHLLITRIFST